MNTVACRPTSSQLRSYPLIRGYRIGRLVTAIVAAALVTLAGSTASAAEVDATPGNYLTLLASLRPGDTLLLRPGVYTDGLPIHGLAGYPGRPIAIRGPTRGAPAVFTAKAGRNTISLVDARNIVVRNLRLDGLNLPADAVRAEGFSRFAHDITIENLVIINHGHNQQTVGISTKCPAWNWIVRGNTIVGAGTGMYFGDSDGSAPFVSGTIERNAVIDPLGYALQIKHQTVRPPTSGIPTQPGITVIRDNVFAKPNAGTVLAARPNVLVGHFPREGSGSSDRYAIYGNFFYQNRHEALFQGEGNIALYANLFFNEFGDAVRIQPHNDAPRRIDVAYNTIVAAGTGVFIAEKPSEPAAHVWVASNVVFSEKPLAAVFYSGNYAGKYKEADRYLRRPFGAPGELDFGLVAPELGPRFATPRVSPALPDWDLDFDGYRRGPGTIGAYGEHPPAWRPTLRLKPQRFSLAIRPVAAR